MKIDNETKFFIKKLELDYGNKKAEKELKKISKKIDWLKGWPNNKTAFWNAEAFMWGNKISKEKRELIKKELRFLEKKNKKNLDLGCGSYSYINSVGFDLSEKMLLLNKNLKKKVVGDLEEKLPFKDGEFDSVTLIFVLDYMKDYLGLLREVNRVLKRRGCLVVVQGKTSEKWEGKQTNKFGRENLRRILKEEGFRVRVYEKECLLFFRCVK